MGQANIVSKERMLWLVLCMGFNRVIVDSQMGKGTPE